MVFRFAPADFTDLGADKAIAVQIGDAVFPFHLFEFFELFENVFDSLCDRLVTTPFLIRRIFERLLVIVAAAEVGGFVPIVQNGLLFAFVVIPDQLDLAFRQRPAIIRLGAIGGIGHDRIAQIFRNFKPPFAKGIPRPVQPFLVFVEIQAGQDLCVFFGQFFQPFLDRIVKVPRQQSDVPARLFELLGKAVRGGIDLCAQRLLKRVLILLLPVFLPKNDLV